MTEVRFRTVEGIHKRYPAAVAEVLNPANEHSIEELARVLGIKLDTIK